MSILLTHWNYFLVIVLMMLGFYAVIARGNMVKKMVGLNIFQTSVFMLYISMGKVGEGTAPILTGETRHGLFQPAAACAYSDGDCCRRCHHGGRLCADYPYSREFRLN